LVAPNPVAQLIKEKHSESTDSVVNDLLYNNLKFWPSPLVLSQFGRETSPATYPTGGVATTAFTISRDLAKSELGPQAWKINNTIITIAVAKSAFRMAPLYPCVFQRTLLL
jgi:hypothetical protein